MAKRFCQNFYPRNRGRFISLSFQVSLGELKLEGLFVTFSYTGEQILLHVIFITIGELWPSLPNHNGYFSICMQNLRQVIPTSQHVIYGLSLLVNISIETRTIWKERGNEVFVMYHNFEPCNKLLNFFQCTTSKRIKEQVENNKRMNRPECASETATFYKWIISLRIISMPRVITGLLPPHSLPQSRLGRNCIFE